MLMKEWWAEHRSEPDFLDEMFEYYRRQADLELQSAMFQDEWKEYESIRNQENFNVTDRQRDRHPA